MNRRPLIVLIVVVVVLVAGTVGIWNGVRESGKERAQQEASDQLRSGKVVKSKEWNY